MRSADVKRPGQIRGIWGVSRRFCQRTRGGFARGVRPSVRARQTGQTQPLFRPTARTQATTRRLSRGSRRVCPRRRRGPPPEQNPHSLERTEAARQVGRDLAHQRLLSRREGLVIEQPPRQRVAQPVPRLGEPATGAPSGGRPARARRAPDGRGGEPQSEVLGEEAALTGIENPHRLGTQHEGGGILVGTQRMNADPGGPPLPRSSSDPRT